MTTRAYLSIGDVLTLLREEFPDVTISKIRFLESQGLVNPERSPSGYRKFYEQDVERLRWVLRQQREHFLPLKVIRDRLQEDGSEPASEPGLAAASPGPAARPEPVPATVGAPAREVSATVGEAVSASSDGHPLHTNGAPTGPRVEEPAFAVSVGASERPADRPAAAVASGEVTVPPTAARAESVAPAALTTARASSDSGGTASLAGAAKESGGASSLRSPAPVGRHERPGSVGQPTPPVRTASAAPRGTQPERPSPRRDAVASHVPAPPQAGGPTSADDRFPASAAVSGASLTVEELCSASGLSVTEVASLEGFGLIEPMTVAGILYYDEEALVVAKLVAEFGRFGIEPRHLRLYRNAVDREVGLVEQIVTPLLRQRNPEARQRAVDAAADLAKLGQGLRASLLRRELRRQLGS